MKKSSSKYGELQDHDYQVGDLVRVKRPFHLFARNGGTDSSPTFVGERRTNRLEVGDLLLIRAVRDNQILVTAVDVPTFGWWLSSYRKPDPWIEPLSPLERLARAVEPEN